MSETSLQFYGDSGEPGISEYKRILIPNKVNDTEEQILVMIDTGAIVPVWSGSASELQHYYPKATKTTYECKLAGFGGEGEFVPTWEIPEFKLQSGNNFVTFHKLDVAIDNRVKRNFKLIMSIGMLRECATSIILGKRDDVPIIELRYSNPDLYI